MKIMKKTLKMALIFLLILIHNCIGISQTTHSEPKTLGIGSKAPDFNLLGVDGKMYSLKDLIKHLFWLLSSVAIIVQLPRHMKTGSLHLKKIINQRVWPW